jgi:hypothetical protein
MRANTDYLVDRGANVVVLCRHCAARFIAADEAVARRLIEGHLRTHPATWKRGRDRKGDR